MHHVAERILSRGQQARRGLRLRNLNNRCRILVVDKIRWKLKKGIKIAIMIS